MADSETTWRKTSPVISEDRRKFVGRENDRRGPDRGADSASSWRSDPSTFRSREEVRYDMREQSREDDRYGRPTEERREDRSETEGILIFFYYDISYKPFGRYELYSMLQVTMMYVSYNDLFSRGPFENTNA